MKAILTMSLVVLIFMLSPINIGAHHNKGAHKKQVVTTTTIVQEPIQTVQEPVQQVSVPYTQEEIQLMAQLVYAEARGEVYKGQVAVAAVVLNRVKDSRFPNNIRDVIYEQTNGIYQFCPVRNGTINNTPTQVQYDAVLEAMKGSDPSLGALFFYNPKTSTSTWILSREITIIIGNHNFAK